MRKIINLVKHSNGNGKKTWNLRKTIDKMWKKSSKLIELDYKINEISRIE